MASANQPDPTLNPDEDSRKKTVAQFFATTAAQQKYGDPAGKGFHFFDMLQRAQRDSSGNWVVPGFGGRPKDYTVNLSDFGGEFAQLGKDYSSWISQMSKTNEEYANYVGLTKANPGRDATILGGQGDQLGNTLLGSARSTVFG